MQLAPSPELAAPPAPEAVAKTDKSVSLRLRATQLDRKLAFQVSHSEHGYVYYSWAESEIFAATMHPVKGLTPNTNYVFRARVVDEATRQCSEWSPLTSYIRTFTEEEDAKRAGTYFEHALKLEREQKSVLQKQISKLTVMLDENARVKTAAERKSPAKLHEDMLSSRRIMDTNLSKLQTELNSQTVALASVRKQREADMQMITDLLNEQENLRLAQHSQTDHAKFEQEMAQLREQLESNESALRRHQEQVTASHEQIAAYEASLAATKAEIERKEEEVERLMSDCNRMVQEQADLAAVKQLEIEDALMEAKTSLEQQLDINTYLRDEVSRLREENHHLKNQIQEIDSEIAPKMIRLEDENEQLRAQLAAYRRGGGGGRSYGGGGGRSYGGGQRNVEGPTSEGVGAVDFSGYQSIGEPIVDPQEEAIWLGRAPPRAVDQAGDEAEAAPLALCRRPPPPDADDATYERGRTIDLTVNYFEVTVDPSAQEVHKYHVTVSLESSRSGQRREVETGEHNYDDSDAGESVAMTRKREERQPHKELARSVVAATLEALEGGVRAVHDGMNGVYAPARLPWDEKVFEGVKNPGDLPDSSGNQRSFSVAIKFVETIRMQQLTDYASDPDLNIRPHVQLLDVVTRNAAVQRLVPVGRAYFSMKDGEPMRGGRQLCWGYHQSVHVAKNKLLLNMDQAVKMFYATGPLVNLVMTLLGGKYPQSVSIHDHGVQALSRLLKRIEVVPTHRAGARKRPIVAVGAKPAGGTFFELEDGESVSMTQYFRSRYNVTLRYPNLPPVNIGSSSSPVWLPIELCEVAPGQQCKVIAESDTAEIIKHTSKTPDSRINHIVEQACRAGFENDPNLAAFGVQVKLEMEDVEAKVIEAPVVQYATISEQPVMGSWSQRGRKFVSGAVLKNWGVVVHAALQSADISKLNRSIALMAHSCGMKIANAKIPVTRQAMGGGDIEEMMQICFKRLESAELLGPPQLIFVVVQEKSPRQYAEIKRTSDTMLGIPSQCLVWAKACRFHDQYLANVCLKVNMKLGGRNWILRDDLPLVSSAPTIVIGAHIHHAQWAITTRPSIAAVTASVDRYATKYVARVESQGSILPYISELSKMVREVLMEFYRATRRKPAHIIYYREGVSERQLNVVLQKELKALRHACLELSEDYAPPVTFISVTREHHMRSFCVDRSECDGSGNVPPGTLVDAGIVDPHRFEFFLYGHSGIQGTSRPAHYTVLHDDNKLTAAEVHKLTYHLCYTYARATRSVSIVPPVYYALLAGERGRLFLGDGSDDTWSFSSRVSTVSTYEFLKLHKNLHNRMFFI